RIPLRPSPSASEGRDPRWRSGSDNTLLPDLVAPQPAQRLRQDGAAVLAVVAAVAHHELVVVLHELQRRGHLLVRQRPVAVQVVEVVLAVLEEDADRLLLRLADHPRIDVAAADVRETADVAEDLAELVRPLPGRREGADAARTGSSDGPAGGVLADVVL